VLWRPHDAPLGAHVVTSDGVVWHGRLGQELQQAALPAGVSCAAWSHDGERLAYAVGDKLTVCKGLDPAEAECTILVQSEMQASQPLQCRCTSSLTEHLEAQQQSLCALCSICVTRTLSR